MRRQVRTSCRRSISCSSPNSPTPAAQTTLLWRHAWLESRLLLIAYQFSPLSSDACRYSGYSCATPETPRESGLAWRKKFINYSTVLVRCGSARSRGGGELLCVRSSQLFTHTFKMISACILPSRSALFFLPATGAAPAFVCTHVGENIGGKRLCVSHLHLICSVACGVKYGP